jgi:hypothetical protein
MKKVKIRNYNVGYKKYSQEFDLLRKTHNVKKDVRKFTKKQYNLCRAEGDSNKDILAEQTFLTKKQQKVVWEKYLKLREEEIKPGDKKLFKGSYWGADDELGRNGLGYHEKFTGLMRDKNAIHLMITNDMLNINELNMTKKEVLAQYGY